MRFSHIADYLKLRDKVANTWEVVSKRGGGRDGQSIRVDLTSGKSLNLRGGTQDHSIFREIFATDVYRLAKLNQNVLGNVIDLGGNVGIFSACVAPIAKRVFAYEPVPENFAQLQTNVMGFGNVMPMNLAVAGQPGWLELHASETSRGTGRFSSQPQTGVHEQSSKIKVPCVTLDSVFAKHEINRCDLLKIDIEGAEYDVLRAADPTTLARIHDIRGEYHPARLIDNGPAELKLILEPHGFAIDFEPNPKNPGYGMFFASR